MSLSTNSDQHRFDLLDFTDAAELTEIVRSFCKVTKLAGGIVLVPPGGVKEDMTEADHKQLRVTEPEVINPSSFCTKIRACERGKVCCGRSDQKNAKRANEQGRAIDYLCHMRLFDLMAPIGVCGRHVANVYLGRIRPASLGFKWVYNRYVKLVRGSGRRVAHQASEQELPVRRSTNFPPSPLVN
ncbi:MAG: Sensory domain found in PocR [Verrucomicrobiota bacterium]|jgi:hypothetical protein